MIEIENAWRVIWRRGEKKVHKTLQGDSPKKSGAVELAKRLRLKGIAVDVISVRRAYPPPFKNREKEWLGRQDPPAYGLMWCPYCVKWREFEYSALVDQDGTGPELFRCPVCTVSIRDHYISKYNTEFTGRLQIAAEVKEAVGKMTVKVPKEKKRRRKK